MNKVRHEPKELMGQEVVVDHVFKRKHEGMKRYWEKIPIKPKKGWIVGFRSLQNGEVMPGRQTWNGWDLEPDYTPAYFSIESIQKVMLVAFSPYTKPVKTSRKD